MCHMSLKKVLPETSDASTQGVSATFWGKFEVTTSVIAVVFAPRCVRVWSRSRCPTPGRDLSQKRCFSDSSSNLCSRPSKVLEVMKKSHWTDTPSSISKILNRNEAQFDSQIFRGPELVSNMLTGRRIHAPVSARVWRLAHIFQDHFRDPNNGPLFPYAFSIMESWEADISRWEAADGKLMFPSRVPSQLAPFSRRHPKPYEFLLVK